MHGDQAYLGRCYIAANREKARDLPDATPEERDELFRPNGIIDVVSRALSALFAPDRLNWAILGNEWNHLHMHVIPRYKSPRDALSLTFTDGRWGKNYAPYDKRPLEKAKLIELRDLLRSAVNPPIPF